MPTLREVQAAMAAALLEGDPAAADLIVEGPERLDIYRNTVEVVLITALRLTFPTVDRLVGGAFFDAMALAFARAHPPASGCLNDWGGDFAGFIADFAPATSVPYLADVARLEWAISVAANAAEVPAMRPDNARMPLHPHPSFSLIELAWPADVIRRAVMEDDFAGLKLEAAPRFLAVHRLAGEIAVRPLDGEAADFTRALFDPEGFPTEPSPDHLALFAEHLAMGCFQDPNHADARQPTDCAA